VNAIGLTGIPTCKVTLVLASGSRDAYGDLVDTGTEIDAVVVPGGDLLRGRAGDAVDGKYSIYCAESLSVGDLVVIGTERLRVAKSRRVFWPDGLHQHTEAVLA
jgi:hypothetical protein